MSSYLKGWVYTTLRESGVRRRRKQHRKLPRRRQPKRLKDAGTAIFAPRSHMFYGFYQGRILFSKGEAPKTYRQLPGKYLSMMDRSLEHGHTVSSHNCNWQHLKLRVSNPISNTYNYVLNSSKSGISLGRCMHASLRSPRVRKKTHILTLIVGDWP